jgi:hypothetical protein
MKVLAVIDMQAAYPAAQSPNLIQRIEAAARAHHSEGWHIVRVNYDGSGADTVNLPLDTRTVWKQQDNGGDELYAYLVGAGLISRDLQVDICGVNLCACVYRTAAGLGERLYIEHAICDAVRIRNFLCGDGSKFRVRFVGGETLVS